MNYQIDLPAADGVGSAQKASFDLPIGPLYKEVTLAIADTAGHAFTSIVDWISIVVNGKEQRRFTADQINRMNKLNGAQFAVVNAGTNTTPGNAGYQALLTIFFQEPWWKEIFHQELFAWGTGNLSKFQINVQLLAQAGITLSGHASVAQSLVTVGGKTIQQPLGRILKAYTNELPIVGDTQKLKTPFSLPNPDRLQCVYMFDPDIEKVTVRIGRTVLFERTKQEADAIYTRHGLVPESGIFALIFDYDNRPENSLALDVQDGIPVTDLTLQLDVSDATPRSIPVIYEVFGNPD